MKLIIVTLTACAAFAQTSRYPGAIDNDSSLFIVLDNVQTSLTAPMASGDTAAVVSSAAGFVPNMIATICDTTTNTGKCTAWEHMLVTAVSGNILTVTRAFAGTTARSHSSGRLVSILIDSVHQAALKNAVIATQKNSSPVFNVRGYGAACDGATDDAAAIQAAVTAADAVGGTVFIPGVCIIGTGITLGGQGTHLAGNPVASGVNNTNSQASILRQKAGANLTFMVRLNSSLQGVRNLVIDGNAANNPAAGDGVLLANASRADFDYLTVYGAKGRGLYVHGTTTNLNCCVKVTNSMFMGAGTDNVYCDDGSSDWFITQTEFENAGQDGLELNTCNSWRIVNSDFGGNARRGIFIYGVGAGYHQISNSQIAGNGQHDLYILGPNQNGNVIMGNKFFLGAGKTNNLYDAILIDNSTDNTIIGNSILGDYASGVPKYRYGIETKNSSPGTVLVGNIYTGTFGTGNRAIESLVTAIGDNSSTFAATASVLSYFSAPVKPLFAPFANQPTCNLTDTYGSIVGIADSNTATWGANIAGSGSNKVLAFCNGTSWTVSGK